MEKLVLGALGAALLGAPALAQAGNGEPASGTADANHEGRKGKAFEQLGLTDQQKQQLKQMHEETRKQMQAIKNDSSLTPEQKKAKVRELHMQSKTKMDSILTAEQQQKMKELRGKHRRGHRGHGRRAGTDGQ